MRTPSTTSRPQNRITFPEAPTNLNGFLLPEFDREMANTRKTLARLPEDWLDRTPHKKSWSMARLATHIANLPSWVIRTPEEDSFEMAPASGEPPAPPPPASSRGEVLDRFDKNIAQARSAMAAADNERLLAPGLCSTPATRCLRCLAVLRSFFMNPINADYRIAIH